MSRTARRAGTTLIEILVVIVVFLIGILAVLQIFPGGLRVLRDTRNVSVGTQLVRTEIERIKGRAEQLADMILPVSYSFIGSGVVNITVDMNRTPNSLGPNGDGIDGSGNVTNGGQSIGYWAYVTGANVMRRVVGEGGPIPAPRPVGAEFGGLMVLQFAPIVYNPAYPALFQIYGNDLIKRDGAPSNMGVVRRDFEYFLENSDDPTAAVYLPRHAAKDVTYRLAMSAWVNNAGTTQQQDLIDVPIPVAQGVGYAQVDLDTLVANFVGCQWDTVRVARSFALVTQFNNGGVADGDPYEYMLIDAAMGLILFDPEGYNYKEPRSRGRRVPLVARVSYDVFDWRILREEFRVPDNDPLHYKVAVGNHKVIGNQGPEGLKYQGINVFVQNGSGGSENRDFLLLDLDSGGIYTKDSIKVDKSIGLVTFVDLDTVTPGLQSRVIPPGQTAPAMIDSAGRSVRALYQAVGEWAVQVMKAPAQYNISYGMPLGIAQCFAGGSSPWYTNVGNPVRIYFPRIDVGKKVSFREIWWQDAGGNVGLIENQEFLVRSSTSDPLGAYVDVTEAEPGAVQFSYSRGYALRGVKGASVTVRALFNPASFSVQGNGAANLESFDRWGRTWRRIKSDTYLQRGEL